MATGSPPTALARLARRAGFVLTLAILMLPAVSIFLWMISLSIKTEVDNTAYPPVFIPSTVTFANYVAVFEASPFARYLVNSIVVSGVSTFAALVIGVPAAYGIAKARATGWALTILLARMTPGLSFLIPLYVLFKALGLTGTVWPLILTHLVITVPIVVWVMMGFFETLPKSLEDASVIDGCTMFQSFRHVALPLARPGITVAAILSFIFSWNNFIFGIVLAGRETRTLPVAVYNVLTFEQISWGPLAAAALIVTLPVLVLTAFIQKQIVTGMTAGAVKE